MLSRLAATRATGLLRQVIKPCVLTLSTRSSSTVLPEMPEYGQGAGGYGKGRDAGKHTAFVDDYAKWHTGAWPAFSKYTEIAGASSGPFFVYLALSHLVSQEVIVYGEETPVMCSVLLVWYFAFRRLASPNAGEYSFRATYEKTEDEFLALMVSGDKLEQDKCREGIANVDAQTAYMDDTAERFQVKRNTVEMGHELEYRNRLLAVAGELQKRLDYQVDLQNILLNIEEKHIAAWVEKEVLKSIGEEREEDTMLQCLKSLEEMAAAKALA